MSPVIEGEIIKWGEMRVIIIERKNKTAKYWREREKKSVKRGKKEGEIGNNSCITPLGYYIHT